jgi:hypothetical protein
METANIVRVILHANQHLVLAVSVVLMVDAGKLNVVITVNVHQIQMVHIASWAHIHVDAKHIKTVQLLEVYAQEINVSLVLTVLLVRVHMEVVMCVAQVNVNN